MPMPMTEGSRREIGSAPFAVHARAGPPGAGGIGRGPALCVQREGGRATWIVRADLEMSSMGSTSADGATEVEPMEEQFSCQRLDVYKVARELAVRVVGLRIGDREIRDQATRAVKSAFLQLAEGLPQRSVPMRRKYFSCAQGSLHEVVAAIDLANVCGDVADDDAKRIVALAHRFDAMLRVLLR